MGFSQILTIQWTIIQKESQELDIKVPVKTRDIQNIEKKNNFIGFSVSGYENNKEHPIYVSKKCDEEKKHSDLLLIGKKERNSMFLWTISILS